MLQAHAISYAYLPGKPVLQDISFRASRGEVTFILGANGSGKTTLLECLCGARRAVSGTVTVDGTAIESLHPRERARAVGYVPQIHEPVFAYTVWEVALMGRAPHLGFLSRPTAADWDEAKRRSRWWVCGSCGTTPTPRRVEGNAGLPDRPRSDSRSALPANGRAGRPP